MSLATTIATVLLAGGAALARAEAPTIFVQGHRSSTRGTHRTAAAICWCRSKPVALKAAVGGGI